LARPPACTLPDKKEPTMNRERIGRFLRVALWMGLCPTGAAFAQVGLHQVHQLSFTAADAVNPFTAKSMTVTFTGTGGDAAGKVVTVGGYWDGGTNWGARFAPMHAGAWSWKTDSTDAGLGGKTGTLTVTPSANKGRIQVRTGAPNYFQWSNGEPYLIVGDTWWRHLWTKAYEDGGSTANYFTDAQWRADVDKRRQQGFNHAHVTVSIFSGSSEINGQKAFTDVSGSYPNATPNADTLNPAFFQQMDARIAYAADKQFVISMINSWADHLYWSKTTDAQSDRLNQYLIDRYAAFPVIWMCLGEYDEGGENARWTHMADYYRTHDPYRNPVTFHPERDGEMADPQKHLDYYSVQRYTDHFAHAAESRKLGIPYVNAEYGYEGDYGATNSAVYGWRALMGGAAGVVYGHSPYWRQHAAGAIDSPGAGYMTHLSKFWQDSGVAYWTFDAFTALGSGRLEAKKTGGQHVVWVETDTAAFQIDLSDLAGTVQGRWFDALNGTWGAPFELTGGGRQTVTPPGQYQALLAAPP
jgi:hypothetical protein